MIGGRAFRSVAGAFRRMSSRYRTKIVLKLFPSVPKGAFGGKRTTAFLEKHVFYREFEVEPRRLTLGACLVGTLALWSALSLGFYAHALFRAEGIRSELARTETRADDRQVALNAARRDYFLLLSRLQPMNEKVDELGSFAGKLATVAGVENLAASLGAPIEERNTNLALAAREIAVLDQRFERVGSFLETQEHALAHAPSISPLKDSFVPTDRFGYRTNRFTRQPGHEGTGGNDRQFHAGLDLAAPVGTPIHATADGTVHFAGRVPAKQNPRAAMYGNFVVIDHGNGVRTVYGHCDQLDVEAGEEVRRGQLVAWVGNTGRSTGPHLHYEVVVNGRPMDPEMFVLDVTIPDRRVHVAFDEGSVLIDEVEKLLGS
jgi:murein DD-endopeptidase MepM/ murein hydrolase activator NlpD